MARDVADRAIVGLDPLPMTYEEWLDWTEGSVQSEWVDGEAIRFMPAITVHMLVAGFVYRLLIEFVERFDLGQVIYAPFEMRLEGASREPDVLFVANAHFDRLTAKRLIGPADLVVEIVSDDSVRRDRVDKLKEYAEAGIPEYWLIDPRPGQQRADFFWLGDDRIYRPAPLGADGRYRSRVLDGFWLDPSWFWRDPLPKLSALPRTWSSGQD